MSELVREGREERRAVLVLRAWVWLRREADGHRAINPASTIVAGEGTVRRENED